MPYGDTPGVGDLGARLRHYRLRAGMSRATLASHCDRTPDWVKRIETGSRGSGVVDSITALLRAAEVLGIDIADLVGVAGFRPTPAPRHPLLPHIAEALRHRPADLSAATPVPVPALTEASLDAWRSWHTEHRQRTTVGHVLPELIRDARSAIPLAEGEEQRDALAAAARIFTLTLMWLSGHTRAAPVAALSAREWAIGPAHAAQDALLMAAAVWAADGIQRELGNYDTRDAEDTARLLSPASGEDHLAMWGVMRLSMSMSFAAAGREGDALRHWDAARNAVRRLQPMVTHSVLRVTPAVVDSVGVWIQVRLSHPRRALLWAEQVDQSRLMSWPQRAFLEITVAEAHAMIGEYEQAVAHLERAQRFAPEDVALSPAARELLASLEDAVGPSCRLRRIGDINTTVLGTQGQAPP